MSQSRAVVRSVDDGYAIVEVAGSGCGRCHEAGGCGGAGKADLFCHGRRYRIENALGARVGEHVEIGIADGAIGDSATRAYVLPLLFLIAGAVCGGAFGDSSLGESTAIAGAALGLLAGWLWLRVAASRGRRLAQPKIVGRC